MASTSSTNDVRMTAPTSNTSDTTYIWSDEETRLYLQLRIEERDKGNSKKAGINDTGKQNILDKFSEVFGSKHTWGKFRNKYNTCKKQYASVKRLAHRTGLGYHSNGSIDMSEDWWEQRIKEWPGARKIRDKPLANMDLMERLYGSVYISGAEGWSAQQGEDHLDTIMLDDDDAASESRKVLPPPTIAAEAEPDVPSTSNIPKASKKRRAAHDVADAIRDAIRDSSQSRDEILSKKNHLLEQHPDYSCSQIHAMRALHSLSCVRMWSPLYKAAILHLQENPTNRQTFLAYEEDENKVLYLEFATGENRYA